MTDETLDQLDRIASLIYQAPLGQYLGRGGAEVLARHCSDEVALGEGEFLFRRSDRAESFFMVSHGKLAVVREATSQRPELVLHVLDLGDLVGELSFLDGTPHTVSIRAVEDSRLLRFGRAEFDPMVEGEPRVAFDFMRAVVTRIHHTAASIARQQQELTDFVSSGGKRT
ncbi:MAG: cyclic nucleotide-binding domain-containing protein [Nocardioidaceae bacterium]